MIIKSLVQKLSTNTIKEKRPSGLFFFYFFLLLYIIMVVNAITRCIISLNLGGIMDNTIKLATLIKELESRTIRIVGNFVLTSKDHSLSEVPVINDLDLDCYMDSNISMLEDVEICEYSENPPEDHYINLAKTIFSIVDLLDESRSVIIKIDDDLNILEVKVNY